jgi:hypothetical protein
MNDLKSLPDYGVLEQLARALWRNGSVRGAALLVGAGFTRNVLRPGADTPEPPLWWDLEHDLVKDLYQADPKRAPKTPLRIAEEYRTSRGQAALDDFIRTRFPDKAWLPGPLHLELLNLPWSDVLTTNWDTVLERTSEQITDYSYEVVRHEADLPHARSPRIVKLHGSIGDKGPLIFAEEDYRKYPMEHAAFVNLARQVFIENELCLLGFSGDDPNFLQWAGWVRDQLGGSARRIYLVGNLSLPDATRQFLQTHNIAPIDLAPAVAGLPKGEQHGRAAELFFAALRAAKPAPVHEWALTPYHDFPMGKGGMAVSDDVRKIDAVAKQVVDESTDLLARDRKCYPGWLVCPRGLRQRLQHGGAEQWVWRKSVLDSFPPQRRAEVLYEIVWRRVTAFQPIENSIELQTADLLSGDTSTVAPLLVGELAHAMMRDARLSDDAADVERWGDFIERVTPPSSPVRVEALYQRCLRARDIADFRKLEELSELLVADEPDWKLRRAAIAADLGRYVAASRLIQEASLELERRYRLDRTSLWIKSRLGWADWLAHFTDISKSRRWADFPRQRDFEDSRIDPFKEIELIEKAAEGEEARIQADAKTVTPMFSAGHYRDNATRVSIRNSGIVYRMEADQLLETVGLPIRLNHVSLCGGMASDVTKVSVENNVAWHIWVLRSVNSETDTLFTRYFGRVALARLSPELAKQLISTIKAATDYWLERMRTSAVPELRADRDHASRILPLYLTALAHLTVRMSEAETVEALRFGLALAKDILIWNPAHMGALKSLVTYAAESISKDTLGKMALEFMEFPLSSERVHGDDRFYPRIVQPLWRTRPVRNQSDPLWLRRVQQLLCAAKDGASREDAILRLTYLDEFGVLLPDERIEFGEALWAQVDDDPNPLPKGTGLFDSVVLDLPHPPAIDVSARVQARVIDGDIAAILALPKPLDSAILADKQNQLFALQNAKALLPLLTPARAREIFDQLVSWRPNPGRRTDSFGGSMITGFNNSVREILGDTLAYVMIPQMDWHDITEERGRALLAFIADAQGWRAAPGLPRFAAAVPTLTPDITTAIRRGILGADHAQVGSAANAVVKWADLAIDGNFDRTVPRSLIERIIAAIESRQVHGLQTLIIAATKLVRRGFYDPNDISRLVVALSDLRTELRYEAIDEESMMAVSISLVRAECVTLARQLGNYTSDPTLDNWIADAKLDPLPEVRQQAAATPRAEEDN